MSKPGRDTGGPGDAQSTSRCEIGVTGEGRRIPLTDIKSRNYHKEGTGLIRSVRSGCEGGRMVEFEDTGRGLGKRPRGRTPFRDGGLRTHKGLTPELVRSRNNRSILTHTNACTYIHVDILSLSLCLSHSHEKFWRVVYHVSGCVPTRNHI